LNRTFVFRAAIFLHKQQEFHHREQSARTPPSSGRSGNTSRFSRRRLFRRRIWLAWLWLRAEAGDETPEDYRDFVGKRIMTSKLIAR
jgi:hypothetical protein